jgi:hypothetical protein
MPATEPDGSGPVGELFRYQLYGMSVETEEPIPGITETHGGGAVVRVRFGRTPEALVNPLVHDQFIQITKDEYLLAIAGHLRLHVSPTDEITVERVPGGHSFLVWTYVLGVGLSVIGLRRGYIPLHAASIEACGGCVALAGSSGAGKSTLSASMTQLGHVLLSDDLCLAQPQPQGPPLAGSGLRETRLLDDAADLLDVDHASRFDTLPSKAKAIYRFAQTPPALLPLRRIYVLGFSGPDAPPGIYPLKGVEALQAVLSVLRLRLKFLTFGLPRQSFESVAAVTDTVAIYRFIRPHDHALLPQWSRRLSEHLAA